MPSWNLERSLSQWGLAAAWQGSPLGDLDASEWSAGGGSGGAGRRRRASLAHCRSSCSGQAASSGVPGGPARCFTFCYTNVVSMPKRKVSPAEKAARRPSSVLGVSPLRCDGSGCAQSNSGAGHHCCPLLLQMPVADLAHPALSSECHFPPRNVSSPLYQLLVGMVSTSCQQQPGRVSITLAGVSSWQTPGCSWGGGEAMSGDSQGNRKP